MLKAYLTLAIVPFLLVVGYVIYKFTVKPILNAYTNKSKIGRVIDDGVAKLDNREDSIINEIGDEIDEIAEKAMSSAEEAKVIIFDTIYKVYDLSIDLLKSIWHYTMHYFVLLMKLLRDFSDWVYTNSRDRFVETAAKERKSVRRFWKYLKEYKKESDSE